jgi:DNA-binding NtrC family response regulator
LTHNGDVTYTPPRGKKGVFIKKEAKRRLPETVGVVMNGADNISSAVEAIKINASDYLEKPFSDNKIKSLIEKTLEARELAYIKECPEPGDREKGRLSQKCEVIRVLVKASQDMRFWRALIEKGSNALSEY